MVTMGNTAICWVGLSLIYTGFLPAFKSLLPYLTDYCWQMTRSEGRQHGGKFNRCIPPPPHIVMIQNWFNFFFLVVV